MNLSSINLRFFANIAPLIGGLNKAERALDQTGRKFESIGKGLTKSFTAPVAALGALSVSVFTGFEQQMSKVKAVSGASSEEFNKLKENAEKLGASTIFTAKQVAELQTEFAKLGFTAKEITQVTEATLALAQATDTDLAAAAAVAGATLRGFGLDASETGRVTDVMALSFSRSALDMEKFSNSMKYVAPVANAAGVSLEETTAMLAILANAGISGSQAGTSLRRILTDLGGESVTTTEKFDKLASKGITISNAMDEVGRTAQSALLVILKNRETLPGLTKDFENSEGAALSMSKILGDTLFGSLKGLSSASEGAMIQIGELVSVALRPLIDMATKIISSFNNMNPTIKKLVVGFTLATATIGPAILAIGGLVRTFALLKAVMMATNPILLAVGLAVGVIAMAAAFPAMGDYMLVVVREGLEAARSLVLG
jgi:phage-related minor tail protein